LMMRKKAIFITVIAIVVAGLAYLFYYGAKPPAEAMKPEVKGIAHSWGLSLTTRRRY